MRMKTYNDAPRTQSASGRQVPLEAQHVSLVLPALDVSSLGAYRRPPKAL